MSESSIAYVTVRGISDIFPCIPFSQHLCIWRHIESRALLQYCIAPVSDLIEAHLPKCVHQIRTGNSRADSQCWFPVRHGGWQICFKLEVQPMSLPTQYSSSCGLHWNFRRQWIFCRESSYGRHLPRNPQYRYLELYADVIRVLAIFTICLVVCGGATWCLRESLTPIATHPVWVYRSAL